MTPASSALKVDDEPQRGIKAVGAAQPGHRRGDTRVEVVLLVEAERLEQALLGAEVPVQRRARDAGLRGDVGQLQLASSVPGEHDERGRKDPAPCRLLAVGRPGRCHNRHFTSRGPNITLATVRWLGVRDIALCGKRSLAVNELRRAGARRRTAHPSDRRHVRHGQPVGSVVDGEDLDDRACPRQLAAGRSRRRQVHQPRSVRRGGRRVPGHRAVDCARRPKAVVEPRGHRRRTRALPGSRTAAGDPGEPRCDRARADRIRRRAARQLRRGARRSLARPES